jgi:uncharacterized membrane protein YeaQ/YmgE (transglycosylase-associated protein family)
LAGEPDPGGWRTRPQSRRRVIGAFVGGWLLSIAGISLPIGNELISQIITATIGAVVVIVVARVIAK